MAIKEGTLRENSPYQEIYLNGEWRICQSRVHLEDLAGEVIYDGKWPSSWPHLVLPFADNSTI